MTRKTASVAVAICTLQLTACSATGQQVQSRIMLPDENYKPDVDKGARAFTKSCAACHGKDGMGSEQGPPLIHKTYRPDHHSDMSFYKAVQAGTYQHHWRFGNMPAIKNLSPENTADIIAYVRGEQRKAGIK